MARLLIQVVARLKHDVSLMQAQAQMDQIASALERAHPVWNKDSRIGVRPLIDHLVGAQISPRITSVSDPPDHTAALAEVVAPARSEAVKNRPRRSGIRSTARDSGDTLLTRDFSVGQGEARRPNAVGERQLPLEQGDTLDPRQGCKFQTQET